MLPAVKNFASDLNLVWVFPYFKEYLRISVIVKICNKQQHKIQIVIFYTYSSNR